MPDKKTTSVPFESSDQQEQNLWAALGELPRGEPSPDMRRSFYQRLEQAAHRTGVNVCATGWACAVTPVG